MKHLRANKVYPNLPTSMPFRIPNSRGLVVALFIIAVVEGILLATFFTKTTATDDNSIQLGTTPVVNGWTSGQRLEREAKGKKKEKEIQEEVEDYIPPTYPDLTFDDLILGEHITSGSRSIKLKVELPEWWHERHTNERQNMTTRQKRKILRIYNDTDLIVKIANKPEWGNTEMLAHRKLNENRRRAYKHSIMPLIWGDENFENPFYAGKDGKKKPKRKVPKHLEKIRSSLRKKRYISALVVPSPADSGRLYSMNSKLNTIEKVSHFMRTLLETLDYANSVGVNNNRLTANNLRVDEDGDAVLTDWSGMHLPGEEIYGKDAAYRIVPPEGVFEEVPVAMDRSSNETIMKKVKQTSVGSYDIWSAGVQFANIVFQPCRWIYTGSEDNISSLRKIMLRVGGNAKILVNNETDTSDLAELVGLDSEEVARTTFRPPLCQVSGKSCQFCSSNQSFPVLESGGEAMRAKALGFLASMMYIAPQDRPTAKKLLGHPFLNLV